MTATSEMIATVRRYTAEPLTTTYSDDLISDIIETYPLVDALGSEPFTWDSSTQPPTQDENENWIPTYDLNAAAAQIWQEKAAALAGLFDYAADGGNYKRSQASEKASKQARYYSARRSMKTITQIPAPVSDSEDLGVIN